MQRDTPFAGDQQDQLQTVSASEPDVAAERPRRRGRARSKGAGAAAISPVLSARGGQMSFLSPDARQDIHQAALHLLEDTGLAEAPAEAISLVEASGGWVSDTRRLCFPRALVETVLAALPRAVTLLSLIHI